MSKNVECDDRVVRVQIWDTAGQEAFRSITRSYYKNSTCALIVYDITNKKTFQSITSWVNECREMSSKDILMILVGNKTDLEDKRVVSEKEGKDFADENGLFFFETSALNGNQVEETFKFAISEIVKRLESGTMAWDMNSSGIKIGKFPNKQVEDLLEKKKSGCC